MSDSPGPTADQIERELEEFRQDYGNLRKEIGRVIVGQHAVLDGMLAALCAGGNILLEGLPGLGKTRLVKAIAEASTLSFQRVQFTPDLMPADLLGTNVLTEGGDGRRVFQFQRGPIFANLVLADEINRATPRTQSALLEAMAEHHVTIAGATHNLPNPFFVLATQNPIEHEGTYPLPEAQIDRFMVKLIVDYPNRSELDSIILTTTDISESHASPVIDANRLVQIRQTVRRIAVGSEVRGYAIDLILATHPEQPKAPDSTRRFVRYGASPRALQAVILLAKVVAALDGRYHVSKADVEAVALIALRHRIILNFEGQSARRKPDDIIRDVLEAVAGRAISSRKYDSRTADPTGSFGDPQVGDGPTIALQSGPR
jgi:MoxR-like ATPase